MPSIGIRPTPCSSIRPDHSCCRARNTGQQIASCGGSLSRCVRIATVPCAKAQRSPKAKRARTSSSDQRALLVGMGRREGAGEGAVRVLGARPDVALVEMGVQIDEARPDLAAVLVDHARAGVGRHLARGPQRGDPAILDRDVDQRLLVVALQCRVGQAAPQVRVDDPHGLPKGFVNHNPTGYGAIHEP